MYLEVINYIIAHYPSPIGHQPMPYALCPMPYALCPMPYVLKITFPFWIATSFTFNGPAV
jgi:hypothetical protein